ncbi:DODA-type extradiol aromatic ring-opening family dioxygenase [Novosphingobium piscinae]|uniref:Dioxygenase n=1 Tax=Novosphingobium piscinae TaxID=1507448 RepID=A0A7X1FZ99_9SPHN|nr:class III extradiol ring-cleavage dioxygenase [Novosphingobium piscinae]MBC2669676.1 dioxygenase [Novosphingobium piscinae]
MQPTLYLSHGSPMLLLQDSPARRFLADLAGALARPAAIVVVSAHWETAVPSVSANAVNATIHDFSGFPAPLYDLRYPAPGAPDLAERIADLIGAAGLRAHVAAGRGLDHGAWVPLLLAWPDHAIPVLQLSVQSALGPGHHLQLGQALRALRRENVLVLGSGSFTHNLGALQRGAGPETAPPDWVRDFADWMDAAILGGRTCDLLSYRRLAPHAAANHPTDEHLLPLFVALGAAGPGATATRLHQSTDLGVLRMDSYRFD